MVINLSDQRSQGRIRLPWNDLAESTGPLPIFQAVRILRGMAPNSVNTVCMSTWGRGSFISVRYVGTQLSVYDEIETGTAWFDYALLQAWVPRVEPEPELSQPEQVAIDQVGGHEVKDAQKRKTEVLLIQDDPSQAALITKMLSEGAQVFSVHHVRHPEEGLSLLQSREFDVILLDLGPLDSRGLEIALAVRNRAKLMPIVGPLYDEEAALRALQSDIQDYLIKGEITGTFLKRSLRYGRSGSATWRHTSSASIDLPLSCSTFPSQPG